MSISRRVILKVAAVGIAALTFVVEACTDGGSGGGGYGYGYGDDDDGYGSYGSYGFGSFERTRDRLRRAFTHDVANGPGRRIG